MADSTFAASIVKKEPNDAPEAKSDADLEAQKIGTEAADVSSPLLEPDEHQHFSQRAPWLRAGVLGANDGLVSVASLMIGVGGGSSALHDFGWFGRLGGWRTQHGSWRVHFSCFTERCRAGLSCSSYVTVFHLQHNKTSSLGSSVLFQHTSYMPICKSVICYTALQADIEKEKQMQAKGPAARQHELEELAAIYENRGLSKALAKQVAIEFTEKDVIRAHARDELGIDIDDLANPLPACVASAFAFCIGAGIPLLAASFITNHAMRIMSLVLATTAALSAFGSLGAWLVPTCSRELHV